MCTRDESAHLAERLFALEEWRRNRVQPDGEWECGIDSKVEALEAQLTEVREDVSDLDARDIVGGHTLGILHTSLREVREVLANLTWYCLCPGHLDESVRDRHLKWAERALKEARDGVDEHTTVETPTVTPTDAAKMSAEQVAKIVRERINDYKKGSATFNAMRCLSNQIDAAMQPADEPKLTACPGIKIAPGEYSGCTGGADCPVCGGKSADAPQTCQTCHGCGFVNDGGRSLMCPECHPECYPASQTCADGAQVLTVREAAKRRQPLGGPDAQALEGALTMAEQTIATLRSELAGLECMCYRWPTKPCPPCRERACAAQEAQDG